MPSLSNRRAFLAQAAAGTAAVLAAPAVVTASKTDTQVILGEGDYKYEVTHDWPQLPEKFSWQTTHNVALDKAGATAPPTTPYSQTQPDARSPPTSHTHHPADARDDRANSRLAIRHVCHRACGGGRA